MNALAWILGIVLAAVFGLAGMSKLLDLDRLREHFGHSKRQYQLIGLSEIAAAAAVIVGLVWTKLEWIAVAAAVGLCSLMMGALMAHARLDDDAKRIAPAAVMFLVAVAFIIFVSVR